MYIRIYWKVLIWGLLMLVVFLLPSNRLPEGPELPFADKIVHIFLFGIFSLLLFLARIRHGVKVISIYNPTIQVLIIALAFGVMIEFAQTLMETGRKGSLGDLFADMVGSLLGCIFVFLLRKYIKM